ncbi:MAG TPA: hypothetical protein VIH38_10930, partial [Steroidobacteraceae bacterium]
MLPRAVEAAAHARPAAAPDAELEEVAADGIPAAVARVPHGAGAPAVRHARPAVAAVPDAVRAVVRHGPLAAVACAGPAASEAVLGAALGAAYAQPAVAVRHASGRAPSG